MPRSLNPVIQKTALYFVQAPSWLIFSLLISSLAISPMLARFMETQMAYSLGFLITLVFHYLWVCSVILMVYRKFSDHLVVPIMRPFLCVLYIIVQSLLIVLGVIPENLWFIANVLSVSSQIYVTYFFARLLVMAEKQRKIVTNEWMGTFLLAFIEVIGVWFIQPRVNRLFTDHSTLH